MRKFLVYFFIIIFYLSCSREENPFLKEKGEFVILSPKNFSIENFYIDPYNRNLTIGFQIYNRDFKGKMLNLIVEGNWDNQNNQFNKKFNIAFLNDFSDWIERSESLRENTVGYFILEESLKFPEGFIINTNDHYAPQILSLEINGPNYGNFSRNNLPEIYIDVKETNQTAGLTIPRFYKIQQIDMFGNISEPFYYVAKPVRIEAEFQSLYYSKWNYIYCGELVQINPDGSYKIKISFTPENFGVGSYDGFLKNYAYKLNRIYIYDFKGNFNYIYWTGSEYKDMANNVIYTGGQITFYVE